MKEYTIEERRTIAYKVRPKAEWESNTGNPWPYTEKQLDDLGIPRKDTDPVPAVVAEPVAPPAPAPAKPKRAKRKVTDVLLFHDSEVRKHIIEVATNIQKLIAALAERSVTHDASKLESPEREIYAARTEDLGKTAYGGPEYEALMKDVQVAIDHHYANNRHHPEHWPDGIDDMDLVDLMEMLADWAAATKRNKNGNIHKSIEINAPRFKITPQLAKILENTVNRYF